jgi:hypothetical protein
LQEKKFLSFVVNHAPLSLTRIERDRIENYWLPPGQYALEKLPNPYGHGDEWYVLYEETGAIVGASVQWWKRLAVLNNSEIVLEEPVDHGAVV